MNEDYEDMQNTEQVHPPLLILMSLAASCAVFNRADVP